MHKTLQSNDLNSIVEVITYRDVNIYDNNSVTEEL